MLWKGLGLIEFVVKPTDLLFPLPREKYDSFREFFFS